MLYLQHVLILNTASGFASLGSKSSRFRCVGSGLLFFGAAEGRGPASLKKGCCQFSPPSCLITAFSLRKGWNSCLVMLLVRAMKDLRFCSTCKPIELACYSFISIGGRHKTPGSETNDFITHFITILLSKQHEFHVPIFSSCLQVPCGECADGPR